ncbi:AmmeMemoRadiSam system protein B [Candidatus Parcubacteria bacterium]|nr:MAG: AmmeMemoRadiSam system protein B [Candidatus Parcubacteria bacterium]
MSLVFAAITPHPPILIPSVGQNNLKKINQTRKAMQDLSGEFYAARPDTAVIISPHGDVFNDAFTVNIAADFEANFEQFGDFSTKLKFSADFEFIQQLRIKTEATNDYPLTMVSNSRLDHGVAVPLFYLTQRSKMKIVPLGYSFLNLKKHFDFGRYLHKIISKSEKRIAVIASGDLSHCLSHEAPGGFAEEGKIFDKNLIDFIESKDTENILNFDEKFVAAAGECGLRSFAILLGILDDVGYKPEVLSYEGPFGVGYLVANFRIG